MEEIQVTSQQVNISSVVNRPTWWGCLLNFLFGMKPLESRSVWADVKVTTDKPLQVGATYFSQDNTLWACIAKIGLSYYLRSLTRPNEPVIVSTLLCCGSH